MSQGPEFNPDARQEFDEAADWYFAEGGQELKVQFITAVDTAITAR